MLRITTQDTLYQEINCVINNNHVLENPCQTIFCNCVLNNNDRDFQNKNCNRCYLEHSMKCTASSISWYFI